MLNPSNVQLPANEAKPQPPPGHFPFTSEAIIGPSFLSFFPAEDGRLQQQGAYRLLWRKKKKKQQLPRKWFTCDGQFGLSDSNGIWNWAVWKVFKANFFTRRRTLYVFLKRWCPLWGSTRSPSRRSSKRLLGVPYSKIRKSSISLFLSRSLDRKGKKRLYKASAWD